MQSTKFEAGHQPTDCPDARPHGAAIAIANEVIEQIITTHARRLLAVHEFCNWHEAAVRK
jgi:hypothetical protein